MDASLRCTPWTPLQDEHRKVVPPLRWEHPKDEPVRLTPLKVGHLSKMTMSMTGNSARWTPHQDGHLTKR